MKSTSLLHTACRLSYTVAVVVLAMFVIGCSGGANQAKLPWKPYSPAELAKAQDEGKTVIVAFTAAWCLNCQANLRDAINTYNVLEIVEDYDAAPMLADWTDRSPDVKSLLAELNSNSIPVLAIYPADNPEQPIVLKDLLEEQQVIDAIKAAGPSKGATPEPEASPSVATAANSSMNQRTE